MSIEFSAEADPSEQLCREIANLAPANPFYTFEYLEAKRAAGARPLALLLRENGQLVSGCPAFLHIGTFTRSLEIESLPTIPDSPVFWEQLQGFCRESGISGLAVYTAASTIARIPALPGETWRKARCEYVMELQNCDLWNGMRSNFRSKITRSREAGLTVARTTGSRAWQEHTSAVRASVERRKSRGETVTMVEQTNFFEALVRNGRGEIYQAVLNGTALSSAFVARSERAAYYLWAGTASEGMALGASHLLVYEIARKMQEESLDFFNLGGAYLEDEGLRQFKKGFGTTEVSLEAAEFCLGSRVTRKLGRAIDLLRDDPKRFLKRGMGLFAGRISAVRSRKTPAH